MAKRKADPYEPGTRWFKIKNSTYSQAEGRRELLDRCSGRAAGKFTAGAECGIRVGCAHPATGFCQESPRLQERSDQVAPRVGNAQRPGSPRAAHWETRSSTPHLHQAA